MSKLVLVQTPFIGLGFGEKAKAYLRAAIRDSLSLDEIPTNVESLVFMTQSLYENDEEQLAEAQELAKSLALRAELVAFYGDKGISVHMREIYRFCSMVKKPLEIRYIYSR